MCVSDASSANKQSSYATEGICILLAEDILVTPETDARDFLKEAQVALTGGSMHLLHCSSTKAKRVSHSTSHAETNACARALPHAQMIALRLCEPEHKGRLWPSSLTPMRLLSCTEDAEPLCNTDAYVDCMDLFELATGQKGVPLDKGQPPWNSCDSRRTAYTTLAQIVPCSDSLDACRPSYKACWICI